VPTRTVFFFGLLVLAFALLGFPEQEVPVPDRIGISRDWTAPQNQHFFQDVEMSRDGGLQGTIYAELGKQAYGN